MRGCMSVRIYVIYNESMRVTLLESQMSFYEIRLGLFDMPHNICRMCYTEKKSYHISNEIRRTTFKIQKI